MRDGDAYSKKFGGDSGDDPDYFLLSAKGYNTGVYTDSVGFYLADFQDVNNTNDYIIDSWASMSLTALGTVDSLVFELTSTDNGTYGMNTPAYFCMDNFSTRDGLGFTENKTENIVRLYPNPVHNRINLDLGAITANQLMIYDANGRLVYENSNITSQLQIEVSHLNKGLYYFQIITDNGVISKKFIKN